MREDLLQNIGRGVQGVSGYAGARVPSNLYNARLGVAHGGELALVQVNATAVGTAVNADLGRPHTGLHLHIAALAPPHHHVVPV